MSSEEGVNNKYSLKWCSWTIHLNDSLYRFSSHAIRCWFVWRFHAFASSRIITPEFHNITCRSLCKVLQAPASMLYGFIQQDRHQFCIFSWRSLGVPWFVLVLLECLCKWEKYDSLRLNFHENHFHLVLKKFPQTKLITTNSSCTKVKKFSPITPERRRIYYSIAITIHIPVTAGNFPLSSFSWVCFSLESCWRFNINRNKFLRMLNNFVFSPMTVNSTAGPNFGIVPQRQLLYLSQTKQLLV